MEESAQGTDLFEAPGQDIQSSEAKEDAAEFAAGGDTPPGSSHRLERARGRRHSLGAAMADLEKVAAAPSGADGWQDSVSAALEELRLALFEHIGVTEGEGGLLAEILDVAPHFATEVALTKAEHEGLFEALDRAVLTLEGAKEIASKDPEPVRRRVMTLLGRLSLHRQRGADLVYDAYNVDIATAD